MNSALKRMDMTLKVIEEAQNQKSPEEISRICELLLEQVKEILRRCSIKTESHT